MNKQQLAAKIWTSANKMRSKIEANEYKDYILGFIFYKFLSEKEVAYLLANDWTYEYLPELKEDDTESVESIRKNLGYYISYDNLFSTWIEKHNSFTVQNVRDALSAFNRLINPTHKKVFEGIFDTLQTGLSKLGDSASSQTKAINDLIKTIKDIPMNGQQDYDVLGFIYEYLISMFAANAGKKAGEFYTPHEVSLLMSEIVANHLKDRCEIKIYDPTSGSGSLLINIGKSVEKYIGNDNNIKYYAQELKQNTYNLTRMNLIMRGILPDNIVARNGDTLEEDWPYFDENDVISTYNPLYVDAVVSNPPYSQTWDPTDKDTDPRYARFGLAPKGKADYAFLLHDLFHIKTDGIMTIVLPHGVLFRGGEEGTIRKNLIEQNHIDAIIGLPANIFFGTGIPTIIMVLKQKRNNTDVLIVDASKGFVKEGKNNKLRASDIKRIVDVVVMRENVDNFSKIVTRDEIRKNDYNLNIPRYIDSSEPVEKWDIYASMFGGLPISEINELKDYWMAFPSVREDIFDSISSEYCKLVVDDVKETIINHKDITKFNNDYISAFDDFKVYLYDELISKMNSLVISKLEPEITLNVFKRLENIPLIDKYEAYQLLDDEWGKIAVDLEIIQSEGFDAVKKVEENMVIKKKNGIEEEMQDGWKGRILPFDLVQKVLLNEELNNLNSITSRIAEISSELSEMMDLLFEEDKERLLNDDNDAFVAKEVSLALNEIYKGISTSEIKILEDYRKLKNKRERLSFINEHPNIKWKEMNESKDGTYSNKSINDYITLLKSNVRLEEGTYEYIVLKVNNLLTEEKSLKKQFKDQETILHVKTKELIEKIDEKQAIQLLEEKWIEPIASNLMKLPENVVNRLISKLEILSKKYEETLMEVELQIKETETLLSSMIDNLEGNEFDMLGLAEFKKMLGGKKND